MRGRLIFPFVIELAPLDTAGQAAAASYDDLFREPIKSPPSDGQGAGQTMRAELPTVRVRAQVEVDAFAQQQQTMTGNVPDASVVAIIHFGDLERAGLVDQNGDPKIRVGDRLCAIYDIKGALVQIIANPQLFVTETRPLSYGLNMRHPRRNLLLVAFDDREQRVPA